MIAKEEVYKVCQSTIDIKKCHDDGTYLCNSLNSIDKNFLREYYKSDRNGPVVNLRKDICREILLDDITPSRLDEIIFKHKSENKASFRSYKNNFSIIHNILIDKYKEVDDIIQIIVNDFQTIIDNSNYIIWDFKGGRNQGQTNYCFALYNKTQKNQSTSLQLFIDFVDGKIKYGIFRYSSQEYPFGVFYCDYSEFDRVYDYINNNKEIIINDVSKENSLSDVEEQSYTFVTASTKVLKDFENKPMSAKEIWSEIEKSGIYKTNGKTPEASLNTIMSGSSINSNNSNKSKNFIFECVGDKPIKYKLINYMPKKVKDTLIGEGFITIQQLKEILEKNNIKIEI